MMAGDVEYVENVASNFEKMTNGMLTKRQALAFFLFEFKEMDASDVGDHMGIKQSTVYSLKNVGESKLVGIMVVADQIQDPSFIIGGENVTVSWSY